MTPFNFLLIFALLNLAFAGSHATLTKEELHWQSVFPNTPMPKVLHDILPRPGRSTIFGDKVVSESSEGVNDDDTYDLVYNQIYGDPNNSGKAANDPESGDDGSDWIGDDGYDPIYKSQGDGDDGYAEDGYDSLYESKAERAPTKKGVNDDASHNKGNEYSYGNIEAIKETIYFFPETLMPGKKLNLPRLTRRSNNVLFWPQQIAESMPMSSDKLPEILKNFSLKANSGYANNVRSTIIKCERAEIRGEEKYCATSFESFVDLGVSMLGKNIRLLSHQLGKEPKNPLFIVGGRVRDMGNNNIVCHKMKYPYAVYLCHSIKKTTVYEVPLVSMDGTKANALAVCHKDTSAWSPNHIAFQYLKVKPGSVPICHVLDRDTIVWVRD